MISRFCCKRTVFALVGLVFFSVTEAEVKQKTAILNFKSVLMDLGYEIKSMGSATLDQALVNNPKLRSWTFKDKDQVIELEIQEMSSEVAGKEIQLRIQAVESLFEPGKTPYPGALTNTANCGEDRKPKTENLASGDLKIVYLVAAAGSRNVFGNCHEKNPQSGGLGLFYDANIASLVQIKVFQVNMKKGEANFKRMLNSLKRKS